MLSRAEFSFDFDLQSDSASVWPVVERLLELGPGLKFLRDPTRGGAAATLNEIASLTGKGIAIDESTIPVDESVSAASEILGIDPLQAANEGKIIAVVGKGTGANALELLKDCPLARGAAIIGEVTSENTARVVMTTRIGGSRILPEPSGECFHGFARNKNKPRGASNDRPKSWKKREPRPPARFPFLEQLPTLVLWARKTLTKML